MGSREALEILKKAGFEAIRYSKGDHLILRRADKTIIIPWGKKELSLEMVRKVRSYKHGK